MSRQPEELAAGFEQFFTRVQGSLVGQAFVLTGDLHAAHDLAQEALTRTWLNWEVVSAYDDPVGWSRRVLHNLIISHHRKLKVRRPSQLSREQLTNGGTERLADHVDLVRALQRLPLRERRAVVLHDLVGLTSAEVASELDVPAGTVRSWLHRSRQRLAADLHWEEHVDPVAVPDRVPREGADGH